MPEHFIRSATSDLHTPIRVAVQALPLDPEGPDALDGFIVAAIGDTTPPCIADPAGASAELSVTR